MADDSKQTTPDIAEQLLRQEVRRQVRQKLDGVFAGLIKRTQELGPEAGVAAWKLILTIVKDSSAEFFEELERDIAKGGDIIGLRGSQVGRGKD